MANPYSNTILRAPVLLHPRQMNNNIYINLKKNLENQLLDKCYKNYGYICKIIKIVKHDDGRIEAENVEASARFNVEFSCKLCLPVENTTIVATIENINPLLITAINGPITIVITNDRINNNIFFKDNNNNVRYEKEKKSLLLKKGDHIKVTILSIQFYHGHQGISAIGFLEGIPTDKEVEDSYVNQYKIN